MFKRKVIKISGDKKKKGKIRENIEVLLSAIGIALLIRIFVIEAYQIPSGSMIPTLLVKDHLIVNKFVYGVRLPILGWKLPALSKPERGDILIFQTPTYRPVGAFREFFNLITFGIFNLDNTRENPRNYIKRTVGTPGDIVNITSVSDRIDTNSNTGQPQMRRDVSITVNGIRYERTAKNLPNPESPSVETFIEDNKKKKYIVQFFSWTAGIEGDFYIPREDDEVTLELINQGRSEISDTTESNSDNTNEQLYSSDTDFQFSREDIVSIRVKSAILRSTVAIRVNNEKTIKVNGATFNTIYLYNQNRIFPSDVIKELVKKKKVIYKFNDNYYFMMGDNRDNSQDSRSWGLLKEDLIIGSPLIIYFPFGRIGSID